MHHHRVTTTAQGIGYMPAEAAFGATGDQSDRHTREWIRALTWESVKAGASTCAILIIHEDIGKFGLAGDHGISKR